MDRQTYKTIIFSSLISINVVIWHDILGDKFAIGLLLFICIWLMIDNRKNHD